MTAPACPVCASFRVRRYCKKPPATYYWCGACGLLFQHPVPTRAAMLAYAERAYESGGYRDYVQARPMKLRHFEDRFAQIAPHVAGGRLLDVGCSCGYFLEVAAAGGFDVWGLEFSPSAIAAAAPAVRPRIREGSLDALPADARFDVVTAFDLIEHVPDPRAFVLECRARLAPGGTLVLSTPDTGHVLRRLMRSRWPMLQAMQHLHLFSRRALRLLLESAGFAVRHVDVAYKTLTADYLLGQIAPLNPLLARGLGHLGRALPATFLTKHRRVNIGELLMVARRGA